MSAFLQIIKTILIYPLAKAIKKIQLSYEDYERKKYFKKFRFIGTNPSIAWPHNIMNPQYISIGDNFRAMHHLRLEAWDKFKGVSYNPEIIIGNNVVFTADCHVGCINKIVIGDNVAIGSHIYITDHFHGEPTLGSFNMPPLERELSSKGPVIISDNVWIGEGVCIMPGVKIGRNCIIGANSVVTKSFPDNSIIGGVPARIIKIAS